MAPVEAQLVLRPWLRALNAVGKDQMPFAVARTLTDVAKDAQEEVRRVLSRRFEIRSKHPLRGIQVEPAKKRDWPRTRARVGTRDQYIAQHERGGVFRPRSSSYHAIPTRRVKRTKSGRVRKRDRPREIIEGKRGFFTDRTIRLNDYRRRQRRAPTMFLLRRQIRLQPRLGFEDTVRQTAAARMQPTFTRHMAAALRSRASR